MVFHRKRIHLIPLLLLGAILVGCDEQAAKKLPSIWVDDTGEMSYYRFRAELQLLDEAKSFIIEEWVSVWRQMFRIDLIESPGDTRTTLLANKKTNEIFRYEPFTCSLIYEKDVEKQDLGALISQKLAGKFPVESSDTIAPVGIGSLWLHALKQESTFTPASEEDSPLRRRTSSYVFKRFDKYTVPSGIVLYFNPRISLTGIVGLKSLAMIEVQDSLKRVLMRIKILEAESSGQFSLHEREEYLDLFDLPAGYGCQRAVQFDHPFPIEPQSDEESHLVQVETVAIRPRDLEHDFEQWKSHSESAQILLGSIKTSSSANGELQQRNSYLIMETQDYAPDEMRPKMYGSEVRQAIVRRRKRVWDFGSITSGGTGKPSKNDESQVRYFELDLLSGQCLDHRDLNTNTFVDLNQDTKQDRPAPLEEMTLNKEQIEQFLFDLSGFHLLKDNESPSKKPRELVYERRFELFEIRNGFGELIWDGPISVVRYYRKLQFARDFETTAVVYFLSKNHDRLIGKFHIRVPETKRPISDAYLHKSLDIGSCFSAMFNRFDEARAHRIDRQPKKGSVRFSISYSIEPEQLAEQVADSEEFEVAIYEEFLRAMLDASKGQLDLMQLVDISVDFDASQSVAEVSARLLERPSLLSYLEEVNLRFTSLDPPGGTLLTELKANEEGCAESCQHYNCFMFVYCKKTKICELMMPDFKRQTGDKTAALFEGDPGCSLFKARSGRDEPSRRVNLAHLLQKLRGDILDSDEQRESRNSIELKMNFLDNDGSLKLVTLIPTKLESGALRMDDLDQSETMQMNPSNQLQLSGGNDADNDDEQQIPRAEYVLMFKNRKFRRPLELDAQHFPRQEAAHTSYEQCETLCEQSDCRSFSHCQMEQTCQVSQLHQSNEIEEHIEQEDLCFVMTRDYLSKFERTIEIAKPQSSLIKADKVASSRDCAVLCMEERNFKCLSFLYCSISGAPLGSIDTSDGADCYLRRSHAATSQDDPSLKRPSVEPGNISLRPMCDLYTRSFLSEFDKYYGKALPESLDDGQDLSKLVLKGFGAEFCALKCAERTDGSCTAFQACRETGSGKPTCRLLTAAVPKRKLLNGLIESPECTTFILSQDSQLSGDGKPLRDANGDPAEKTPATGNHWLAIVLLLLVGLVVGYGLAMKFVPGYRQF